MTAIKNCAFGQPIPAQGRSVSSTKYKLGDEVLYAGERCIISGVIVAYMVDDKNGELVGIQVAESMLDPADESAQ